MQVTDEAKLIAVRQKLIEAETRLYEASKIVAYLFDERSTDVETLPRDVSGVSDGSDHPVTYPGQIAPQPEWTDEEYDEQEESECME
jgi:hypothetical protein